MQLLCSPPLLPLLVILSTTSKRVLRYLAGCPTKGILLANSQVPNFKLIVKVTGLGAPTQEDQQLATVFYEVTHLYLGRPNDKVRCLEAVQKQSIGARQPQFVK